MSTCLWPRGCDLPRWSPWLCMKHWAMLSPGAWEKAYKMASTKSGTKEEQDARVQRMFAADLEREVED